jgi:hypothetical protein
MRKASGQLQIHLVSLFNESLAQTRYIIQNALLKNSGLILGDATDVPEANSYISSAIAYVVAM